MFKIIIAGCGSIVQRWLTHILSRDDAELAALVDPDIARAHDLQKRYHLACPVYFSLDEALKQSEANLLIDTTPPAQHAAVVTSALQHGLDVLGEKPMADNMPAAHLMLEAVRESGRRYLVMQNRRYLHGIRTLRQALDRKAAGQPYHLAVDMLLGAHFSGFRNEMAHPLLVDMAIHTFDQARYLLADAKAVSAYAQESNPAHSWYQGASCADCIFEMSDGSIFSFRGSWSSRSDNTSSHGRWRVACSKGTVTWDGYDQVWVNQAKPVPSGAGYYEEEGLRHQLAIDVSGREEHDGCLDAMFMALKTNQPSQNDCHNHLHSLAMVHACLDSTEKECKIRLPLH